MSATPGTNQDHLNKSMPAAAKAKLGDLLADLVAQLNALRTDVTSILTALATSVIIPPVLAIKAGGSAVVKSSALFVVKVNGVAVSKAANTDMSALAGVLHTAKAAAWDFYIDDAGTITTSAKTADAATGAAALALLPAVPADHVRLGSVVLANATGGDVTGGVTALDTASLTVTYYNASTAAIFSGGLTAVAVDGLETR